MVRMSLVVVCIGGLAVGCSKRSQDGLPPASEWQTAETQPQPTAPAPMGAPAGMGGADPSSPPRFGMAGGGDPSEPSESGDPSESSDPANPHAGLDMAGGDPANPHAGLDMANPHGGTDVTKLGLAAPDPNRKLDPSHHITGTISVDAKARDKARPGTSIFVIVKRAGPDGAPAGPPLAVDKLAWNTAGVPFELTEADAMVAGTELAGEVIVMARYDQDSDALSRQPGDITGQIRVKIPADNVKLSLDTVLP